MNREAVPHLVSPMKKSPLHLVKPRKSKDRIVSGFLVSTDKSEKVGFNALSWHEFTVHVTIHRGFANPLAYRRHLIGK